MFKLHIFLVPGYLLSFVVLAAFIAPPILLTIFFV